MRASLIRLIDHSTFDLVTIRVETVSCQCSEWSKQLVVKMVSLFGVFSEIVYNIRSFNDKPP
jgi:hypothetical protein